MCGVSNGPPQAWMSPRPTSSERISTMFGRSDFEPAAEAALALRSSDKHASEKVRRRIRMPFQLLNQDQKPRYRKLLTIVAARDARRQSFHALLGTQIAALFVGWVL